MYLNNYENRTQQYYKPGIFTNFKSVLLPYSQTVKSILYTSHVEQIDTDFRYKLKKCIVVKLILNLDLRADHFQQMGTTN